jgi:para-aminobenzoate synthetase/4-amino-4-deoxychorismate lyase
MKGTAAASDNETQNQAIALALKNDEKNRAENLMIVDLLRNDLGRIAQTGTVKVPQLFEVQRFSSVLQMTSNIEAQLRTNINLTEVMSALFPCGSITGAPKCRTMEIIREIEKADRGIYTGAIGWFDPQPDQGHLPDFCLSVPIRTMTLSAPDITGIQHGTMGVGAGIVFDSKAREEYEECQLKARFLTGLRPDFELFETMYATREDGCRDVDQHLMRLKKSAAYFEFTFDENAIRKQLQNTCINFAAATPHRLRLALKAHGEIAIQVGEIKPLPAVVKVLIAKEACHTPALFLRHKTSYRHQYDQAWQSAEREGAFDMLFCNAEGFITEGGRSSIFIRHGKTWLTPPLSDGVLPGIMRAKLLSDTQMNAQEKSFTIDELRTADEIILCNALRGAMRAELLAI